MNENVYNAVKSGRADNNIRFADFTNLITDLKFDFKRQNGSHAIYFHEGIKEYMNIQPDGNKAKEYQVKQLRNIIKEYNL
ncbi:MAG: type II toxin-antitoxin system HicA family toxin [Clostridiales bacterium]|jgi:predicted RNA binding protein YcfA (HicA-like mRNA interferase family)|nr:type II toxin-antitoxin system HicA family toxin [Clostridiales bacterium]